MENEAASTIIFSACAGAGQVLQLSGNGPCAPLCLLLSRCCLNLEFQVAGFQLSLVLLLSSAQLVAWRGFGSLALARLRVHLGSRLVTPLTAGNLLRCGSTVLRGSESTIPVKAVVPGTACPKGKTSCSCFWPTLHPGRIMDVGGKSFSLRFGCLSCSSEAVQEWSHQQREIQITTTKALTCRCILLVLYILTTVELQQEGRKEAAGFRSGDSTSEAGAESVVGAEATLRRRGKGDPSICKGSQMRGAGRRLLFVSPQSNCLAFPKGQQTSQQLLSPRSGLPAAPLLEL